MTIQAHRFIFILLIFLSIALISTAQTVTIPDPNLRAVIEESLDKASGDPITTSDMAGLTLLNVNTSNVSDLTGLEHAINLTRLYLSYNSISDITSLSGLTNLTQLSLSHNSISDITSLSGLTNLTTLNLWDNSVSDITSLSGLTDLTWLNLINNTISDVTSLSGLTDLTELFLSDNTISDITSLSRLTNLTILWLGGNTISDISSLAGLTNLTSLSLDRNAISDLSALVTNMGLGSGDTINVERNPLSSISINTHVRTLQSRGVTVEFYDIVATVVEFPDPNLRAAIEEALDIASGDPITTSDMVALTRLKARRANISDLTGLEHAINLTELSLWGNSISDVSSLAGLTHLTSLSLSDNTISDITSLSGLTNLTSLNLGGNTISDITSLSGLASLTWLWLWGNTISDITSLSGLTNLTQLYLQRNSISDLSALVANTGLESEDRVNVEGNPLSYASINTHIPTLQNRGVTVNFDDRTPTRLMKISGDNQREAAFAPLPDPFVVGVWDERGQPFAGVPVVFTVVGGGGTLSVTNTTTDVDGRAESTLTLGPSLGANTVSVSASEIERVETFNAISDTLPTEYRLSIAAGISLIHVPLKVKAVDGVAQTITSISDFYDALGGEDNVIYLFTRDSQTQEWIGYLKPSDRGTPVDRELTDDMGIITNLITPVPLHLSGSPLGTDGNSIITLNPGINLVGVPLRDSRITHVSDLFTLEGIADNVFVIMAQDSNGEFKQISPTSGAADIAITGGQSFIMTALRAETVSISGDAWTND